MDHLATISQLAITLVSGLITVCLIPLGRLLVGMRDDLREMKLSIVIIRDDLNRVEAQSSLNHDQIMKLEVRKD